MSDLATRLKAMALAWRRAEIALAPDDRPAYLPWIVGVMTFLAALALAAALALSGAANRWSAGMTGTLTVEIAAETPADTRPPEQRLAAVLDVLRNTQGIAQAEPISRDRIAAMIEPWLGKEAALPELPLPQLVDVKLAGDAGIDLAALAQRLATAAPGTTVDDHRSWLDGLLRLAHTAVALALAVVVLVGFAAAGTVAFATRANLAAHHDAIELLHLMGARDAYIARQFARLVLMRSALGAAGGVIAALIVFYGLAAGAHEIFAFGASGPMARAGAWLAFGDWMLLIALAVATIAAATLTAWLTVAHALRNMV